MKLALERVLHRLTALDAAARQIPAWHIAVLHQKDPALPVEDRRAHAKRHAAPEKRHKQIATSDQPIQDH
jgi:hypothetical protein